MMVRAWRRVCGAPEIETREQRRRATRAQTRAAVCGAALAGAATLVTAAGVFAQSIASPAVLDGAAAAPAVAQPQVASLFQPNMASSSAAFAYVAPKSAPTPPAADAVAASEAPSLGPVAAQIAKKLAGRLGRRAPELAKSYAAHGHRPVWFTVSADGAPEDLARAQALVEALSLAETHALPAARYEQEALRARLTSAAGASAAEAAALDIDLSRTYLQVANDIHGGALDPRAVSRNIDVDRPEARVDALMAAARDADDPAPLFEKLAPQSADYARLKEIWGELRAAGPAEAFAGKLGPKTLREGDRGVAVERLQARLVRLGDLDAATPVARDAATGEAVFGPTLAKAVRRLQARNGLKQDAIVGRNTYKALNESVDRAAQIAVNMEQARWRNRPLGLRHILVNIPDFHVDIVENGKIAFRSPVVVGTTRHQTPEFSDEMTHMVVNPRWNVPYSIATEELLPKLVGDPYALQARNIHVYASSGGRVDPSSVNWGQFGRDYFPFRMAQASGRGNALGDVKFMFPNKHAVYLHDTPAKSLFSKEVRAFSHGCVRVAKPVELAEALLGRQESDPLARFQTLRGRRGEQYENLKTAVPVHIVYRTAWVDADGVLQLRRDIYGRDRRVAAALTKAGLEL